MSLNCSKTWDVLENSALSTIYFTISAIYFTIYLSHLLVRIFCHIPVRIVYYLLCHLSHLLIISSNSAIYFYLNHILQFLLSLSISPIFAIPRHFLLSLPYLAMSPWHGKDRSLFICLISCNSFQLQPHVSFLSGTSRYYLTGRKWRKLCSSSRLQVAAWRK